MTVFRLILLRLRNVLSKSCIENQNMYLMFRNFLPKIVPFMRKYGGAREDAGDNMATRCMLGN